MRICRRGDALVVEAPAKLNLFLEVLGRRADGFHDLETVMVAISLRDTLALRPAPAGVRRLTQRLALATQTLSPPPPCDETNLVLRAARLLAQATGCEQGVEIELIKRIPWQAGLGGGSSDAAAALWGLNRLWGLGLTTAQLHPLAAQLGSDLNFFIEQTPLAVCRGRGEAVEARPLQRRLDLVVAQPAGGLSTAAVFRNWKPDGDPRSAGELLRWLADGRCSVPPLTYNALQRPALEMHAGVERLCDGLAAQGAAAVTLTGSGSACFGLCRSSRQAQVIARKIRLESHCPAWAVHAAL